ncbi:hypothetical protein BBD42_15575 [Paenibacillus sp. BIHB 4019]|uniref:Minor capsid protein n=1 Tax=Paenibacillus sp. BIHB 4019 TaxID=1870819 RepID=A0A1B2DJ50_9BACL|nr:phage minor capsid protein [Paenibacillus sp. BIHB 4019]ANY67726.1 hypothetical protein BBD42_15575 [Paenibacillus sp. BIHB 4019]
MSDIEKDVAEITKLYTDAVKDVKAEMDRVDVANLTRKSGDGLFKKLGSIFGRTRTGAADWITRTIPNAIKSGIDRALNALGIGSINRTPLNRANQAAGAAFKDDTYADLLAVTQNMERRTKAAIRKAIADVMREQMAAGVNGRKTINAATIARIRADLGAAADSAIVDAGGRRWKVGTYVDMVTRTKLMQAQINGTINEALGRGVMYATISSHGAKDACAKWEGRTIKLTPDAPGDYPYIGDLPRREIFHPNCKHVITPIRKP